MGRSISDLFLFGLPGLCSKHRNVDGGAPNRQGCIVVKVDFVDFCKKTTAFLEIFVNQRNMKHTSTPTIKIHETSMKSKNACSQLELQFKMVEYISASIS